MRIRNRLFPYPVINSNPELSRYVCQHFSLEFEGVESNSEYILKNCHIVTDSKTIERLISDGKIKFALVVECSYTVYRNSYLIGLSPKDISLKKADFSEKVDISAFAYAAEPFELSSDEFVPDYSGMTFMMEKYDIIGADDGYSMTFAHDESESNLVHSIFSIQMSNDDNLKAYTVQSDAVNAKKIVITLPKDIYQNYKVIYSVDDYKQIFFNMLLIPSLTECFSKLKSELSESDIDLSDLADRYIWLRSVLKQFIRVTGKEMTRDDLINISSVELAQELLNCPLSGAMKSLVDKMRNNDGDEENE